MWSALCVTLAEILEVRGSNLTEDEAWVLLYAIGRQLKNVPDEISHNFVIVHDNVQLHRNGGLSIKFVSRHQNVFPELHQLGDAIGNALIYSLGMSLLVCLQSGLPKGQYMSISGDLQDLISIMISPQCAHSKFEEITNHRRFQSGDWELQVTECFKDLYKSIFGSISAMQLHQDFRDFQSQENIPKPETFNKSVQATEIDCELCIPLKDEKFPRRLSHETVTEHIKPEETVALTCPLRSPGVSEIEVRQQMTKRISKESLCHKKSTLFCSDPPLQLNLCQMASTFKHASHVTVEYLNQRKLRIHLDARRLTCGHILGVSVYHLIAPLDPGSFCLTMLKDGEYIFLKPDGIVADVASTNFKDTEPHFYLRLKFVPDDLNSVLDNHLRKAIYMQTRRDILDGFICCKTEEALLLAAYSLQYEFGDLEDPTTTFRLRDYIPPHIISRHGANYLRVSLQCLHERLKTTTKGCGRTLYMRKALELSEYGSHSIFILLARKRKNTASGRLLISPRGIKVIRVQGEERRLLHEFSWETLEKVSFKNIAISMVAKNGVKVKFYVDCEMRSKYVVLMLGEAHKYHRFHDFQSAEQFSHPIPPSGPTLGIATSSTTVKNVISSSKTNVVMANSKANPTGVGMHVLEATGDESPRSYDNDASHPEISPYELGPGHIPADQPTANGKQMSSNGNVVASVHIDGERRRDLKGRDLPPRVDDELTDVSSQSSEDNVDEEDSPVSQIPEAHVLGDMESPSSKSNLQDEVYARPYKQKPTSTTQTIANEIYTRPMKDKMISKVLQPNPRKHQIVVRHPDIIQHVSAAVLAPNIETGSRGEGDGISNFSGPDQPDHLNVRNASREECNQDSIPEDVTNTIADFEEFKRRLIGKKGTQRQNLPCQSET